MARITSVTETPHAAGASYTVLLGAHDAGDLLLVCVSNDQPGAGTTIAADVATAAAGWTLIGTQASSQATRQVWFKVVATSGAMANPVFTVQNTGTTGTCLVYKEHNGIGGVMRSDWGNSTNINSAASNTVAYSSAGGTTVITPAADSLMVYSWGCDGTSNFMRTKLNDLVCDSRRSATGVVGDLVSHIIGHTQLASAACPNVTMYASIATEGGNGWVIEILNDTGGTLQKQVRADVTEVGGIANWYGSLGAQHAPVTWNKPSTFVAAAGGVQTVTINGSAITLSNTALGTVITAAVEQDSIWGTASSIPNAENAAVLGGGWHTISSSNLDGKIFSFQWAVNVNSSSGRINTEGVIVGFASSDGNYAMYQVCTKNIGWLGAEHKTAIIDLNNAALIASGSTGAGIDWTAITRVGYFWHKVSGTSDTLGVKNACLLNSASITGGSATDPANFQVAANDLTSWGHKAICDLKASAQVTVKFPLQIADGGAHETYFDSSASSAEFERGFSTTQKDWNVNAGRVGITINAGADDTIIMAAGVAASETAQLLTIHAGSSLSATYSFVGESIVGLTPTDNAGLSWTSATFKSGGTVTIAGGGNMTNCSISKTTSSVAAVTVVDNGTVLAGDTIDVTGTSAAYHLALEATVTGLTMNGVTLSGTPGTNKFYSELASGTLAITADGTGTALADTDVTFIGGSTAVAVIAAPQVYQVAAITGLAPTYRIQLFDIEYDLTVAGITVTPTAGATYTHNGITWTVRSASIVAGAGTITVYGAGTPSASGTLTKASGTGDASVAFSAYAVDGTELYIGVPGATSYTWTDSVAAADSRVIRLRVMEDGPGTADAILMIDSIIGVCGTTESTKSVGYLVAAVADDVYNDRGVDGSTVTGITIDDSTLRLEIASGTIVNYNGTDVLVIDGRDIYAYETYWLGTTAGMRDEARFIEAVDAVNFRCSNFKLLGTSGYPIMIRNCYMVDTATGIFASLVDYSGDPISNAPDHMAAIVVSTSDAVISGTAAEIIAAIPSASENAGATLAAAEVTPIHSRVKWINNTELAGAGTPLDPMRPA